MIISNGTFFFEVQLCLNIFLKDFVKFWISCQIAVRQPVFSKSLSPGPHFLGIGSVGLDVPTVHQQRGMRERTRKALLYDTGLAIPVALIGEIGPLTL